MIASVVVRAQVGKNACHSLHFSPTTGVQIELAGCEL